MAKDLWGVEESTEASGPLTDAYGFPMEPHYGKPTGYDIHDRPVDEFNQLLYPNQNVPQGPHFPGRFDPNLAAAQAHMQQVTNPMQAVFNAYDGYYGQSDSVMKDGYGPQVGQMPMGPSYQPMPNYGNFTRGMEDTYGYASQAPNPGNPGNPMQMMQMMQMMGRGPQGQQQEMAPYEIPYSSSYMDGGAPTCMDEALALYYGGS